VLPKIHSSAGDRVIGWISVDIFPVSGTCKGRMSIPAPYPVNRQDDPAADAAGLLLRIGLAILAVGMPIAAILSRRAVFSLMPVGSVLILAAALVSPNPGSLMRLRGALRSPVGLASLFLIGWIALSLLWTPFFNLAAERLFKVAGTAVLVTVASAFLPERTRVANLYLFPVGVSAATLLAIFIALRLQFFPPGTYDAESLTTDRAAITLVAFLWPSLAALAARQRFRLNSILDTGGARCFGGRRDHRRDISVATAAGQSNTRTGDRRDHHFRAARSAGDLSRCQRSPRHLRAVGDLGRDH
jgi:hypothetical protein